MVQTQNDVKQIASTKAATCQTSSKRWGALLPGLMSLLSASLMIVARNQQPMLRGMGMGWEVPARVVNSLINGPGFWIGRLVPIPIPYAVNGFLSFDGDRIPGIAAFWFLVGLSIDRRRNKQALDRQHPIHACALFTSASLVCGEFGFLGFAHVFCPSTNLACWDQGSRVVWIVLRVVAKYPLTTWYTMHLSLSVWLLAFCAYFARRAFVAAIVMGRLAEGLMNESHNY
jgi:hypothetical protein